MKCERIRAEENADFRELKVDWQSSDQSRRMFFQVRQVIRVTILEYPWMKQW